MLAGICHICFRLICLEVHVSAVFYVCFAVEVGGVLTYIAQVAFGYAFLILVLVVFVVRLCASRYLVNVHSVVTFNWTIVFVQLAPVEATEAYEFMFMSLSVSFVAAGFASACSTDLPFSEAIIFSAFFSRITMLRRASFTLGSSVER